MRGSQTASASRTAPAAAARSARVVDGEDQVLQPAAEVGAHHAFTGRRRQDRPDRLANGVDGVRDECDAARPSSTVTGKFHPRPRKSTSSRSPALIRLHRPIRHHRGTRSVRRPTRASPSRAAGRPLIITVVLPVVMTPASSRRADEAAALRHVRRDGRGAADHGRRLAGDQDVGAELPADLAGELEHVGDRRTARTAAPRAWLCWLCWILSPCFGRWLSHPAPCSSVDVDRLALDRHGAVGVQLHRLLRA